MTTSMRRLRQVCCIRDLSPGDRVIMPGVDEPAVLVTHTGHPTLYGFLKVLWFYPEGHPLELKWSLDTLDPRMRVDYVVSTPEERLAALAKALEAVTGQGRPDTPRVVRGKERGGNFVALADPPEKAPEPPDTLRET